jgi:RNA polymerase sigma-70 factor, ECF subfamily
MSSFAERYLADGFPRRAEVRSAETEHDVSPDPLPSSRDHAAVNLGVAVAAAGGPQTPVDLADETLLSRICGKDDSALALLFRRYARLVHAVAFRVLRDAAEADDLVQEVFLSIHRSCQAFDPGKGTARTWILQITYRRAISRRRYLSARRFYQQVEFADAGPELEDFETAGAYERSIEGVLGTNGLRRAFEALSENQRHTLRLYFFEGYTLDEIAVELSQPRENIKNHYFRGLERLRRQIFGKK